MVAAVVVAVAMAAAVVVVPAAAAVVVVSAVRATPVPEMEALQAAIDNKASADEIKTKLGAFRKVVNDRADKVTAAQETLKKLLTPRQEAIAVVNGLLK